MFVKKKSILKARITKKGKKIPFHYASDEGRQAELSFLNDSIIRHSIYFVNDTYRTLEVLLARMFALIFSAKDYAE